jgi:hypothetical protein
MMRAGGQAGRRAGGQPNYLPVEISGRKLNGSFNGLK